MTAYATERLREIVARSTITNGGFPTPEAREHVAILENDAYSLAVEVLQLRGRLEALHNGAEELLAARDACNTYVETNILERDDPTYMGLVVAERDAEERFRTLVKGKP